MSRPCGLQAARKKAEELLQAAIAAEMDAKNKLEDMAKRRTQEQRLLDDERTAIERVRAGMAGGDHRQIQSDHDLRLEL